MFNPIHTSNPNNCITHLNDSKHIIVGMKRTLIDLKQIILTQIPFGPTPVFGQEVGRTNSRSTIRSSKLGFKRPEQTRPLISKKGIESFSACSLQQAHTSCCLGHFCVKRCAYFPQLPHPQVLIRRAKSRRSFRNSVGCCNRKSLPNYWSQASPPLHYPFIQQSHSIRVRPHISSSFH